MTPAERRAAVEKALRRFAATVPTGRRVRVKWRLLPCETEDRVTVGPARHALRNVIYVGETAIPKLCVTSIESAEPRPYTEE